jgi:diguanylate cyclase (GGDEF)-like protein/PAS domain S-box-containing protein
VTLPGDAPARTATLPIVTARAPLGDDVLAHLLARLPAAVSVTDEDGIVTYWNRWASELYGWTAEEAVGRDIAALLGGPAAVPELAAIAHGVSEHDRWEGTSDAVRPDGRRIHVHASIEHVTAADLGFAGYLGVSVDHTAHRRLERSLVHAASHDPLTGLANRWSFADHLEHLLELGWVRPPMVMVVAIDGLKLVNDSLGHPGGDAVLRRVAAALLAAVPPGDVVARFAGDQFLICCHEIADAETAIALGERVVEAVTRPQTVDDTTVSVSATVGAVIVRDASMGVDTILRDADAAMARTRSRDWDRARVVLYDDVLREGILRRVAVETGLRRALHERSIDVAFQPLIRLADGVLVGAEALARWTDPVLGVVEPTEFIPIAEATGMISWLGEIVLRAAVREASRWRHLHPERDLTVSVNVSALQLRDEQFPHLVSAILAEAAVAPATLCLELTESAVMDDDRASIRRLAALKQCGVRLSLDDFGTGYSSLAHLKGFPLDCLKAHESFVAEVGHEQSDAAIIVAIAAIGRTLGLDVVAEGIETPAQAAEMARLGCAYGQGHLWSPAVPPERFDALVRRYAPDVGIAGPHHDPLLSAAAPTLVLDATGAVRMIAHELRNSLTVAMYWASTMAEAESPDDVAEAAEAILGATLQMTAVLSTIDDLAALDQGTLVVDPSPFDLAALVRRVADQRSAASRREIEVDVPEASIVTADEARIEQVLVNLVGNAQKFSPPGTPIAVTLAADGDGISVAVHDHGPGVDDEHVGTIFRKWGRADHGKPGTGLGLYLARGIARAHGGDVRYRRPALGGGSVFTLSLPPPDAAAGVA